MRARRERAARAEFVSRETGGCFDRGIQSSERENEVEVIHRPTDEKDTLAPSFGQCVREEEHTVRTQARRDSREGLTASSPGQLMHLINASAVQTRACLLSRLALALRPSILLAPSLCLVLLSSARLSSVLALRLLPWRGKSRARISSSRRSERGVLATDGQLIIFVETKNISEGYAAWGGKKGSPKWRGAGT